MMIRMAMTIILLFGGIGGYIIFSGKQFMDNWVSREVMRIESRAEECATNASDILKKMEEGYFLYVDGIKVASISTEELENLLWFHYSVTDDSEKAVLLIKY